MKTIEISQDQWAHFCERVGELHHGAMVDITVEEPEGGTKPVAEGAQLRSIVIETQKDACNDIMIIGVAGPADKGVQQHRIIEPIHIRLKDGKNNRYNHIHILGENGNTVLTLHPGLDPVLTSEFSTAHQST